MTEGFKSEAEGYAASLRQQAACLDNASHITNDDCDTDELREAAKFIERQQVEIESLRQATPETSLDKS